MDDSLGVDVHPAALAEFHDADDWYTRVNPEVAERFRSLVFKAFERIDREPLAFPLVHGSLRRCVIKGFPYVILFDDSLARTLVVAIAHTRRKPGYWQGRVKN